MKSTSLLLFIISPFFLMAQQEQEHAKKAHQEILAHYKNANYDGIFNLFDSNMKQALSQAQTSQFFSKIQDQFGAITSSTFKGYQSTFAIYSTTFGSQKLDFKISVDQNGKINGLNITPPASENQAAAKRNSSSLLLPFKGTWFTFWGGDTVEQNYHVESPAQKNAFDFVIFDEQGKTHKTDGLKNEDYYAFGKPIIAPCDGEVILVVDGIKDNVPGAMNPVFIPGNTVIIKTKNEEYLVFAHFKQHSIVVKQDQQIKQGDFLGACGNSGNSSEAHLHFHIQNQEDFVGATGIKCFFNRILVNGKPATDYSPVKNDKIENE